MAEPVKRVRKDGTVAWYSRVKLADGSWSSERMRAAKDRPSARKINHELQEAEDRKAKGLAPGGLLFAGTFGELCDYAWKKAISKAAGATQEASRLHHHGGAIADRECSGPSRLGPMPASQVTKETLEDYFADLEPNPRLGRAGGLKASSINRIRATLSTVFEVATKFGKWPKGSNPARETVERDVDEVDIRTLRPDQILAVIEAAEDYWAGPFAVCLLAGLRRGEMLALKKADVHLEPSDNYPHGWIHVRRSATELVVDTDAADASDDDASAGDELGVESASAAASTRGARDTTKGKRHDAVPIHPELVPYLERWMLSPSEWMFPDHEGCRRSANQRFDLRFQAAMVRAGIVDHYEFRCRRPPVGSRRRHGKTVAVGCPLRRAGGKRPGHMERHPDDAARRCPGCGMRMTCTPKAPKIGFHGATRHTFATAMLESGATLQGVQKLMRHSDPRLTTEIYGHLAPSFLADELGGLDLRALPKAGERRRRVANGGERRGSATVPGTAHGAAPGALVAPLRRGARADVDLADLAMQSSMKIASGMVEPRGIEPLTYALRMHDPLGGAGEQRSQPLATASHFSPEPSISASHVSARFGAVSGGLVAPVRRGSSPATHVGEGESSMLEQRSPALASDARGSAPVLLSVAELARRLRVSVKWVRHRIDAGELAVMRVGGTRVRVRESDVEAFLARMQR